ncbi:MAG: TIGR04283 family arsenosugar biosynthesis glycosyltransferase [Minwuia sp.]|uniref:TIGR04283 family arsenosugar biosynthesis glycosyltransferase n=1 Tax=Minwuia sp. TaxID=2493630 RepID=UPI003A85F0D2
MSRIAVIIPALNAEAGLAKTIESVAGDPVSEIVVSDGGSADRTREIAEPLATTIVIGPKGRGGQLRRGAEAASADWLLFLHADTVLSPSWRAVAGNFISIPTNAERAGVFTLRLDSKAPGARRVERGANWRTRRFGLPYGDQGLLISRRLYEKTGGFRDMPLMEDVDIVRRIGKRRLHLFDAQAITSAARYERDGWIARPARNLFCLGLYFLGLPPSVIARIYSR